MLVGRPPFLGANPYDTLLQVLKKDPLAPSQLVPRLPKDVETICLKCLEKDPAKRYADAAALAEDCRRYRNGEPILSRPISGPERAWRWCKRNPRTAALLAAVAGLLVTVAAGSSVAAMVILAERNAKEEERKKAVTAQAMAEAQEQIAKDNEKIATEQSALALGTLQNFVDQVQEQLDDAPRTRKLKQDLLETAIDTLDQVSGKAEQTTSIDATLLAANFKYAKTFLESGQLDRAIDRYRKCLQLAEADAAAKIEAGEVNDRSQFNVASVESTLGELVARHLHDPADGLARCRRALEIAEGIAGKPPSLEGVVAPEEVAALADETRMKMAFLHYLQGNTAFALPLFRQALAARRQAAAAEPGDPNVQFDLSRSIKAVGEAAFLLGNRGEGYRLFEESLSIQNGLVASHPGVPPLAASLAISEGDYGDLFLRDGSLDLARPRYDEAVEILEGLVAEDQENAEMAQSLALAWYRRGQLARREGDAPHAAECFRKALAIRERLATADPSNVSLGIEMMLALAQCGERARAAAIADGLPTEHDDREILLAIARCAAICATSSEGEERQRHVDRSIAALTKAIETGYSDAMILHTDPDLDGVRADARFPTLELPAEGAGAAGA